MFFAPITPRVIGSIGNIHGVRLVSIPPKKAKKKASSKFDSTKFEKDFVVLVASSSLSSKSNVTILAIFFLDLS